MCIGDVPDARKSVGLRVLRLCKNVDELNVYEVCIFKKGSTAKVSLCEGAKNWLGSFLRTKLQKEVDDISLSNQELSSLLSDPLGPGLIIFLWSSTRGRQFLKSELVIQSDSISRGGSRRILFQAEKLST